MGFKINNYQRKRTSRGTTKGKLFHTFDGIPHILADGPEENT
jgi:hypothetical protein